MPAAQVQITIADEYLQRFDDVVRRCRRAGLNVDQQLSAIGVLTGTIEAEKLAALQKVKGVAAVEQSSIYQIPPPESDLQ